jgi:uncharacterized protein (DUF1684 family)
MIARAILEDFRAKHETDYRRDYVTLAGLKESRSRPRSCSRPPTENRLTVRVLAGEKTYPALPARR